MPFFRTLTGQCHVLVTVSVLIATPHAWGQFDHTDISFSYRDSKIAFDQQVFPANYPVSGIAKQFSSNPGYASERDVGGGIGANDELIYHVLEPLTFWAGEGFVALPPEAQVRIRNNPPSVPDTVVSSSTSLLEGSFNPPRNRIGKASAAGDVHSHVSYFLEMTDDSEPLFGAYGLKLQLASDRAGVEPSDPFYVVHNYGLDSERFGLAMTAFASLLSAQPGDLNGNGVLDAGDIDQLSAAVRSGDTAARFDLNQDGVVDAEDRQTWVEQLANTYFGDADLSGEFASGDLVKVFQQGEYEDVLVGNSTWSDGDWDGDAEFSSADFVIAFQAGGYELGPRSALAVPEPASGWISGWVAAAWIAIRRRSQQSRAC